MTRTRALPHGRRAGGGGHRGLLHSGLQFLHLALDKAFRRETTATLELALSLSCAVSVNTIFVSPCRQALRVGLFRRRTAVRCTFANIRPDDERFARKP